MSKNITIRCKNTGRTHKVPPSNHILCPLLFLHSYKNYVHLFHIYNPWWDNDYNSIDKNRTPLFQESPIVNTSLFTLSTTLHRLGLHHLTLPDSVFLLHLHCELQKEGLVKCMYSWKNSPFILCTIIKRKSKKFLTLRYCLTIFYLYNTKIWLHVPYHSDLLHYEALCLSYYISLWEFDHRHTECD